MRRVPSKPNGFQALKGEVDLVWTEFVVCLWNLDVSLYFMRIMECAFFRIYHSLSSTDPFPKLSNANPSFGVDECAPISQANDTCAVDIGH